MIQYAATELLTIAYREEGSKNDPTVILLHGWPDDPTTWNEVIPQLVNAGYRAIAPWLRGFGATTFHQPTTVRTGNSGIHALDILALMDVLELNTVSLIGHDWGANIAEALAVGWPDRIERMALLSTPPRLGGVPTPPFEHAQLEWYHWFQATRRGEMAVRADPIGFAHLMWVNWSPEGWFREETFQQVAQSWTNPDFVDVTLHSYRSRWDEAEPDPKSLALEEKIKSTKKLALPTLYIQGEVDGVNPPQFNRDIPKKFTGPFEIIQLPGVGHFPSREAPNALSAHLLRFLAS